MTVPRPRQSRKTNNLSVIVIVSDQLTSCTYMENADAAIDGKCFRQVFVKFRKTCTLAKWMEIPGELELTISAKTTR